MTVKDPVNPSEEFLRKLKGAIVPLLLSFVDDGEKLVTKKDEEPLEDGDKRESLKAHS